MEFVSKLANMKNRLYIEIPKDLREAVREEFSGEYIKVNIDLIVPKRPRMIDAPAEMEKQVQDVAEDTNKYVSRYNLRKRKK